MAFTTPLLPVLLALLANPATSLPLLNSINSKETDTSITSLANYIASLSSRDENNGSESESDPNTNPPITPHIIAAIVVLGLIVLWVIYKLIAIYLRYRKAKNLNSENSTTTRGAGNNNAIELDELSRQRGRDFWNKHQVQKGAAVQQQQDERYKLGRYGSYPPPQMQDNNGGASGEWTEIDLADAGKPGTSHDRHTPAAAPRDIPMPQPAMVKSSHTSVAVSNRGSDRGSSGSKALGVSAIAPDKTLFRKRNLFRLFKGKISDKVKRVFKKPARKPIRKQPVPRRRRDDGAPGPSRNKEREQGRNLHHSDKERSRPSNVHVHSSGSKR